MFDRYRLLLGSIAASTSDDDIAVAASRLSSDTAAYQRGCVERITQLTQLSKQCTDLTSLCDTESEELSKLVTDVKSDTIGTHIHLENKQRNLWITWLIFPVFGAFCAISSIF